MLVNNIVSGRFSKDVKVVGCDEEFHSTLPGFPLARSEPSVHFGTVPRLSVPAPSGANVGERRPDSGSYWMPANRSSETEVPGCEASLRSSACHSRHKRCFFRTVGDSGVARIVGETVFDSKEV